MSDNEHKMLTRSKRKKRRIDLEELPELEFSDSETENLEIQIEEEIPNKKVKFIEEEVN